MPLPKKPKTIRRVYLDHAAATPVDPKIKKVMLPFFDTTFGNPSALYSAGVQAKKAVDAARKDCANILHAQPDTIVFTSGGTESTNLAITGVATAHKKNHIITTDVEHAAVLEPIKKLEQAGYKVTYLPVDKAGRVRVADLKKALTKKTVLVSVMYANNEIGTIQPIADIGRALLRWRKQHNTAFPYFHSDACQAGLSLRLDVEKLHVDLLSINGSKLYGPKGVGLLYKRRGVTLDPQILGGGQEMGYRSGTENVAGIVGLATAMQLAHKEQKKYIKHVSSVRNYFWRALQKHVQHISLVGPDIAGDDRLINNVNVTFHGVDAEALIIYLDAYGIMCASGAACATGHDTGSHVLRACGVDNDDTASSIRFTLGKHTTKKDIDYVVKYLPGIVQELQKHSN